MSKNIKVVHGSVSHPVCFDCLKVHKFGTATMIFNELEKHDLILCSLPYRPTVQGRFDSKEMYKKIKAKWLKK